MTCINCNNNFKSKRNTAKYCSTKCRVYYSRSVTKVSVTKFKDYTAQDLYDAIALYEQDTWKNSPEYKELIHRLDTIPVEQLRKEGYSIPNRYEGTF